MARTVGIGIQDFGTVIEYDCFYVDKTNFIKEWWESRDSVTLIARPRRFGKTLTMSMLEHFFSVKYAEKRELFSGLKIWEDPQYRELQGTYPVISLSFASIKENNYKDARKGLCRLIAEAYSDYAFLLESGCLTEQEQESFRRINSDMGDAEATPAIHQLSKYLSRYYGKKVVILLDEYDTPMQEAYVNGFWDEIVCFIRSMFNATFKTNPYLERGIMTGITRVSKESIFSDLNNLKVVTTTSNEYCDAFGFTEEEVFAAMDEQGLPDKELVKAWYDGFTFGSVTDIYNPWSILNYLDTGKLRTYWANTSSNSLVGKLIREGDKELKQTFESLLKGESITADIDEQIVYNQLDGNRNAVWSLLLASGYLKVLSVDDSMFEADFYSPEYELALTNGEVKRMFGGMVKSWFAGRSESDYNDFIKALLSDDIKWMNVFMNRIALNTISYFDSGTVPSGAEPERFYHGLVLGLLVELNTRYTVTSNRESGYGRYDIMLEPRDKKDIAIIIEFKVYDGEAEEDLKATVQSALRQIEEKKYAAVLVDKGIPIDNIRKYGFAFEGKKVLIG